MSGWNMKSLRGIAGLPVEAKQAVNESWDDDHYGDDEDPDVKIASKDKGQEAFEKKNKKTLSAADKEATAKAAEAKKAKPAAEKKSETPPAKKTEEKKPEPEKAPAKAEPKKEEEKVEAKSEEAKKRGKAPDDNSQRGQMRSWYKANEHRRGDKNFRKEFHAHAAQLKPKPMSHHAASAYHATLNPKSTRAKKEEVKEGGSVYILCHPSMPSYTLAENYELNRMQWVDGSSDLNTLVFETEAEAQKVAKYLAEWQGQSSVVSKVTYE